MSENKKQNFTEFANSFQAVARLNLEGIRCLMKHLGNPQNDLKYIHVAGTNGKGSVCAFLQCILTDSGYTVGKYTSPNLVRVSERITVDGTEISEPDLKRIMERVEAACRRVELELGSSPTQFEIWTAAAFIYFKERRTDIVVLETGLGGAQDATNVIPPPLASVITGIDIDHTSYLGNTISEIAAQKAGIIKDRGGETGLTVSAIQQSDAAAVLEQTCRETNNKLIFCTAPDIIGHNNYHEIFNYKELKNVYCGITGVYQPDNAALAIETALALGINAEHIFSGIKRAENPARFEIFRENPPVIYDGAHNRNGMQALAKSINRYFPDFGGAEFIVSFMADKDIDGVFEVLTEYGLTEGSCFHAVRVEDNPRAATAGEICAAASKHGISCTAHRSISNAISSALSADRLTIVCGSLYLYKDFIGAWQA